MKKNLHYLTQTLVATALLASTSSYALGVGDITMQSALNQNLKAEIALILSAGENSADLEIGLAPITKFDDAGIPWALFLSKIEFKTVTENGKTVIKLSSKEVLKEPFLDFILQIRSAKSHLYREFTVLVDPPEFYQTLEKPIVTTSNVSQHFVSAPVLKTATQKLKTAEIKIKPQNNVAKITLKPKVKFDVQKIKEPKIIAPAPELNQKVTDLEKQLSEMKQAMNEQNAQIAALKLSNSPPILVQPEIPLVLETTPTSPVLEIPTSVPVVSVPILPTPIITPPEPPKVAPNFLTKISNSAAAFYANIPTDSYNYIAGAVSSLLLSLFGLLRWKNRRNSQKQAETDNRIEPEIIVDAEKSEINNFILPVVEQSMDKMFSDEVIDFEDNAVIESDEDLLPEFHSFTVQEPEKKSANDVLYRVDVYCAYGNFDHAILLLNDEFSKQPDMNDYALRLLQLYVSQHKKEGFKSFVEKLKQKGKQNETDFWEVVLNIISDFYPDILLPVESNLIELQENFEPFVFENLSHFENTEALDKTEEPPFLLDSGFDLDFTTIDVEKEDKIDDVPFLLDSEFELDFTTFETEKTVVIEAPKITFEPEFNLDFKTFNLEKSLKLDA